MARTHARVQAALWVNEDWRRLSAAAQRVYLLLISQPQINNCGVLPLVLKRWARLSADTSPKDVVDALGELEQAAFIVCDWDTEEALVRTFIKHDRIERQPNLVKSAQGQFSEIQSPRIRSALVSANPHLFKDLEPLPEPLPKDLREPLSGEPLSEPLPEGGNAHAREGGRGRGKSVVGEVSSSRQATSVEDPEPEDDEPRLPAGSEKAHIEEPEPVLPPDPEPTFDEVDVRLGHIGTAARRELERLRPRGASA